MSTRFEILDTTIEGLTLLKHNPIGDHRGYLERIFCSEDLKTLIRDKRIIQINHTLTAKLGAIRGLHFQYPPHAETKFVSCLRGEVFDVAVDLRRGSPTFLHWHAEILSADNHKTLVVPDGFAHGFQTLTKDCELLYLHTSAYHEDAEGGLNARDPRLDIQWPLPIAEQSTRDAAHPFVSNDFRGISF